MSLDYRGALAGGRIGHACACEICEMYPKLGHACVCALCGEPMKETPTPAEGGESESGASQGGDVTISWPKVDDTASRDALEEHLDKLGEATMQGDASAAEELRVWSNHLHNLKLSADRALRLARPRQPAEG